MFTPPVNTLSIKDWSRLTIKNIIKYRVPMCMILILTFIFYLLAKYANNIDHKQNIKGITILHDKFINGNLLADKIDMNNKWNKIKEFINSNILRSHSYAVIYFHHPANYFTSLDRVILLYSTIMTIACLGCVFWGQANNTFDEIYIIILSSIGGALSQILLLAFFGQSNDERSNRYNLFLLEICENLIKEEYPNEIFNKKDHNLLS